ncbi:hypothetical protein GQ55_6G220300 [Panicum hallii var. hallii]|uniref:Uncharacterized protein n=1 Tax=Panicum hallii var. hallii TaxID=1504633 RepID=A0A2T7D8E7_9POAL|nr:hypothetical protein GQ55_6G220300 [Panicum hallii var. hallii]
MIESSNSEMLPELITGTGRQNVVEVCCSRCCPTAEEANGELVIQSINGNNVRSRSLKYWQKRGIHATGRRRSILQQLIVQNTGKVSRTCLLNPLPNV